MTTPTVHANAVLIGAEGVLIRGRPGSKSQRVLRVKSGTAMRDNELRFVASSYIP